jgi:membrane-anchored protein YejM (alkaline phosphatase superfamily)
MGAGMKMLAVQMQPGYLSMNKSDQYLATVVAILFLAGIFSFVQWARERSRARQRWSGLACRRRKNVA